MRAILHIVFLGSLALVLAIPANADEQLTPAPPQVVVAEVNKQKIFLKELEQEAEQLIGLDEALLSAEALHRLRSQTLQKMVDRKLLLQAAEKRGIDTSTPDSTEIAIRSLLLSYRLELEESDPHLLQARQGVAADEREFFLEQLSFNIPEDSSLEEIDQLFKQVARLRKQMETEPTLFSKLIAERGSPRARWPRHEEIPLTINQIEPALRSTIARLEPDTLSPVLSTENGFHIVKKKFKENEDLQTKITPAPTQMREDFRLLSMLLKDLRLKSQIIIYLN